MSAPYGGFLHVDPAKQTDSVALTSLLNTAKRDEQASGIRADEAKGYGLWVAKVVAARNFGRMRERATTGAEDKNRRRKWHILSGERQTDKLFDHEIVERIGAEF
jgi:hypothetical protein